MFNYSACWLADVSVHVSCIFTEKNSGQQACCNPAET